MKKSVFFLPHSPYVDLFVMVDVIDSNDDIVYVANSDMNAFGCDDPTLLLLNLTNYSLMQ